MTIAVDTDTKIALLRKQSAFARLTDKEIASLAKLLHEVEYEAGEHVVREGDPVDSIFIIVNGSADVRHVTVKDNALHVEPITTLGPAAAIGLGDSGFYSISGLRTATVVANTKLHVLKLSVPQFHGFALDNSHVNEEMRKHFEHIK